jgi:hypothetical protein
MSAKIKLTDPDIPLLWRELSYDEIMTRAGGLLINDGRASRVFRFTDGEDVCFLKRYNYHKIHWHHCWQKSQVRREYENLNKIKTAGLDCEIIEVLAYGEERHGLFLHSSFLLSRAVPKGESLSLFLGLNPFHPQRRAVIIKLLQLGQQIIKSGLAITDLFFRNLVVVPKSATLYILDVQRCDRNRRRARRKTYPQFWSNILLFCTPEEQQLAAEMLATVLPCSIKELHTQAQQFIVKEKKRQTAELALSQETGNFDYA